MKSESRLRAQIVTALRARGHLVVVQHGSAFSQSGVSDLLVCRNPDGKFLALEIKTGVRRSVATPLQTHFICSVAATGGIAFVVRSVKEALMAIDVDNLDDLDFDLDDLVLPSEREEDDDDTPAPAVPTKSRGRPRKTPATPRATTPSPRTPRRQPAPVPVTSQEAVTLADDENDQADEPLLTRYEQLVKGLSTKMDAVLERLDEAIELMTAQGAEM